VLLQHGFFKRGTKQKLVYAKDSGEIALVPNLYGNLWTREANEYWAHSVSGLTSNTADLSMIFTDYHSFLDPA
jgi:hypothetical protein